MPSKDKKVLLKGLTVRDAQTGRFEKRSERYDYADYECRSFKSSAGKYIEPLKDFKISVNLNNLSR